MLGVIVHTLELGGCWFWRADPLLIRASFYPAGCLKTSSLDSPVVSWFSADSLVVQKAILDYRVVVQKAVVDYRGPVLVKRTD